MPEELWFSRTNYAVDKKFDIVTGQMEAYDPLYHPGLTIPPEEIPLMPGLGPKDKYIVCIVIICRKRGSSGREREWCGARVVLLC